MPERLRAAPNRRRHRAPRRCGAATAQAPEGAEGAKAWVVGEAAEPDGIIDRAMSMLTSPGVLPQFDAALRGALWALLALLGLSQLRLRPRLPIEQLGLALALGLAAQVVVHAPWVEWSDPAWWKPPLVGVAMGNAVLGWLFARALCDDRFQLRPLHAVLWLAMVAAGTANLAWLAPWCRASGLAWAGSISQAVFGLPLVFGLLTVHAAATEWRADLVEGRRWLRAFIVVGASLYTLAMVLARRGTADGRLTPELAAIDAATLLVIVGAVAWLQLRPVREGWQATPAVAGALTGPGARWAADGAVGAAAGAAVGAAAGAASRAGTGAGADALAGAMARAGPTDPAFGCDPSAEACPPDGASNAQADDDLADHDPAEQRLAAALHRAITVQRVYKDPALTVAGLAARLSVPEYRLRRHINRRLGHRNFNAFLNGYRLDEAKSALADPRQSHLPVLTLALEAGFGSIGPFNRAFKQATGLTPTDFRRQHGTDF